MKTRSWAVLFTLAAVLAAPAAAQEASAPATTAAGSDPRVGLAPNAQAASGLELVANRPKPERFNLPAELPAEAAILFANSDLAFQDDKVFVGNFFGFNIYDISDPANPELETSVVCPGGQGDLSVHGDLLFMSVEMPNGRTDCGIGGFEPGASPDRFLGVRIFDISDLDEPKQVAAVQTCRGSHTHTLVTDPDDDENVYIYVSGTSTVRPAEELAGCIGAEQDPNSALFRIEVIKVPLDEPEKAEIVSTPRIFADRETGEIAGLFEGGPHGPDTQTTARTDQCHDITAYPELGIAAGACSGNGILLDISDPANPTRTEEVTDPNFAYWHSATFNNDATKVIFTDEWGGGTEARCRATDPRNWGADAIFDRAGNDLTLRSYYKLPVPQTPQENCVAHNGSIIPVPGRDIMVQAWYQGGISVFDFTDSANPIEIAYFDRGPIDADTMELGGQWSAYWYNGRIYASEITRGLDVLKLVPGEHLTANEIAAAEAARRERLNVQSQQRYAWPDDAMIRATIDQIARVDAERAARLAAELERAEVLEGEARSAALAALADGLHAGDADGAEAPAAD